MDCARDIVDAPKSIRALDDLILLPVVPDPGNILCMALNYQSHIDEAIASGETFIRCPEFPLLSPKVSSTLAAHHQDIQIPARAALFDYEIELAFVIGASCKNVKKKDWRNYVAGFCVSVDMSIRVPNFHPQIAFETKNFDGAFPIGPWLVTTDEIDDVANMMLSLRVNGELRQFEAVGNCIFDVGDTIEYWSSRMTLSPGDIFTLGTPSGVGAFAKDPSSALLKPGDVVEASIGELGTLRNRIVAS